MPRKHKRKLGSREYKNYTEETLQNALDDIESQTLSMRQAATRYNIPVATLSNKWNGKHVKKSGGQNVLTAREEEDLQSVLTSLSIWRAPLSLMEIRMLVKSMLDKEAVAARDYFKQVGYMIRKAGQNKYSL